MKKFVSLILALVLFIVGFAFAEDSKAERVYVRGEIREMLDMTEEALSDVMNEAYQNGLKYKLYEVPVQAFLVPPADENFRLETRFFCFFS